MTDEGHGRPDDPWWASGADRLSPEPDPLAAYRRVRLEDRTDASAGDPVSGHDARPGTVPEEGWSGGPWTVADGVRADERPSADRPSADGDRLDDDRRDADRGRDGGRRDRTGRGDRSVPEVDRSGFEDVMEGMAALMRAAGRRARRDGRTGRDHDPACRSCPWCTVTRSLGDARPEVTEHLEQAARHLVLAARAWVDAADQRTSWERIPIDDEEQQ